MNERTAIVCGCITEGKIVRGMCVTHYDRWVHATPKDQRGPSPRASRRFDDFVVVDQTGCWVWTGSTNRQGYGQWSGQGFKGLAHRFSLARAIGAPEVEGLFACHHCDNPPCVNPDHLYWGTVKDNAADVVERIGIYNKGVYAEVCKLGHPIEGDNLRISGSARRRRCRECDNRRKRDDERRRRNRKKVGQ